ncbi:flagellar hook basal-body protein [Pseudogemmobacter faecipullorum]|uniref:Flagellar basal-body rod protein FlgF n=1 Tax=Pseudogemmobacter faecipullorum TaxID=2755041 RepID=A0ABS8CNE1_9RHOB|nr:flagellar hook basal-body protein [Pseudogemmobacter faecipullorum]MCB5410861.1 flagellar hook basal-body protein [Pseudogemmobacter faecipullorum]
MDTTAYLPLAAAAGLQRSLDVTAHNLANASTAGYRGQRLVFESLLAEAPTDRAPPAAYGHDRLTYSDLSQGALTTTGNPLDLAIQGEGWFGYEAEDGQIALGRDGRLVIDAAGLLMTTAGRPVLDAGGGQIQLDPEAGPPSIGRDGTISDAAGNNLGQIGLFTAEGVETWARLGESLFQPRNGQPVALEPAEAPVMIQGALEGSNINPVTEMVRLIGIQRSFDQVMKVTGNHDDLRRSTLQRLGQSA